ncbi:MAG: Mur ligase, partial [Paenibacillaceae bacterium]|nr:Mur ligase [Paenibacillaceae bacterium]
MTFTFALLAGLAWLGYAALRIRRGIHMLQLNSYRNSRYWTWNKNNWSTTLPVREWFPLAAAVPALFGWEEAAFIALTAVYLLLILLRPKEKDKKKLVFTNRVKRLAATAAVLALAVEAAGLVLA